MQRLLPLLIILLLLSANAHAQVFPNPASLSTGQGTPGTFDPIWTVSNWYSSSPPNPMGLTYSPALINNNCAPGSWVDPASLPFPINNGNWITGGGSPCASNTNDGWLYFRLTLNLPADCNGNSVATSGSYVLYLTGYVDNTISDVFINGNSTGISGGAFSAGSQLNMTLSGPWVPGVNYIDIMVYNFPNGGSTNPYGLLLVANSIASSVADGDGDGVTDINDMCPCGAGTQANGCAPVQITGDTVLCAGETTTLTVTGMGTYAWNTGATGATITVNPVVTTRYSAVATASNGYTDSAVVWVTVNQLPLVSINPSAVSICAGSSVTLTAGGAGAYVWSNSAVTGAITATPAGTSTYTVTGTDANTCSATASSTVTVNPLPVAGINPSAVAICAGVSTTLTASGGGNYVWSNAANTASITASPAATTNYAVSVTDANNCTATSSATVTVIPTMILALTQTQIACNGNADGAINLTANSGQSPYNFLWNTGVTAEDPNSLTPGNYAVTVTDNAGCTATISTNITEPAALVLVSSSTHPTCLTNGNDGTITLNLSGGTLPYQFNWSNGAGTANLLNVAPGNYDVTVSDANNCTAGAAFTLSYVYDFSVQASSSVTIKLGESSQIEYLLTGNAGNYTAFWNPSSTLSCSDCVTAIAAPNVTTLYQIEVQNDAGCVASDTVRVSVIPDYSVFMPTAFTPDNDGNNDVFTMFGNKNSIVYMLIQIFNRSGEKVFESLDHNFVWDGRYKGVLQNPSVFTWQMKLTFIDGHHEELRKGTVTLLR